MLKSTAVDRSIKILKLLTNLYRTMCVEISQYVVALFVVVKLS